MLMGRNAFGLCSLESSLAFHRRSNRSCIASLPRPCVKSTFKKANPRLSDAGCAPSRGRRRRRRRTAGQERRQQRRARAAGRDHAGDGEEAQGEVGGAVAVVPRRRGGRMGRRGRRTGNGAGGGGGLGARADALVRAEVRRAVPVRDARVPRARAAVVAARRRLVARAERALIVGLARARARPLVRGRGRVGAGVRGRPARVEARAPAGGQAGRGAPARRAPAGLGGVGAGAGAARGGEAEGGVVQRPGPRVGEGGVRGRDAGEAGGRGAVVGAEVRVVLPAEGVELAGSSSAASSAPKQTGG
jgi:hypothetical protein